MNYLILIQYKVEIDKGNSESGDRKECIAELLWTILRGFAEQRYCEVLMISVTLDMNKNKIYIMETITQLCCKLMIFQILAANYVKDRSHDDFDEWII